MKLLFWFLFINIQVQSSWTERNASGLLLVLNRFQRSRKRMSSVHPFTYRIQQTNKEFPKHWTSTNRNKSGDKKTLRTNRNPPLRTRTAKSGLVMLNRSQTAMNSTTKSSGSEGRRYIEKKLMKLNTSNINKDTVSKIDISKERTITSGPRLSELVPSKESTQTKVEVYSLPETGDVTESPHVFTATYPSGRMTLEYDDITRPTLAKIVARQVFSDQSEEPSHERFWKLTTIIYDYMNMENEKFTLPPDNSNSRRGHVSMMPREHIQERDYDWAKIFKHLKERGIREELIPIINKINQELETRIGMKTSIQKRTKSTIRMSNTGMTTTKNTKIISKYINDFEETYSGAYIAEDYDLEPEHLQKSRDALEEQNDCLDYKNSCSTSSNQLFYLSVVIIIIGS